MDTPWQRARKTRHEKQEQKIGNLPGGQKQVNSGRIWRWKRDGILHGFLVEARTTKAGSYSIKKSEFLQIRREALQTPPGLLPAMQIDLDNVELMVISLPDFNALYSELLKLRERVGEEES